MFSSEPGPLCLLLLSTDLLAEPDIVAPLHLPLTWKSVCSTTPFLRTRQIISSPAAAHDKNSNCVGTKRDEMCGGGGDPALELNKPRLHPFLDITPVLHLRTSAHLGIRRQEENEYLERSS